MLESNSQQSNTPQKALEIYDTLTKQKRVFKPIVPNHIGLYVCGPTVYDYCHIGHARLYLIMDTIVRYLRSQGYQLKYIRNITDIDDKIIQRANDNNEPFDVLAGRYIQAMEQDLKALNLLKPDLEPKATEYVQEMIDLIQSLIEKGFAYAGENGDVYYNVGSFKSYGCLAHRDLEDLQVGSRVEVNESKRNPLDFVLWKKAKPNEPKWPSPWGEGRPGWHTECSAMSLKNLGQTFDLHGGGHDLVFPHHENERAQSEAVTGKTFVNTWMHIGFLQINKEKMSKSLGNFLTIRGFLEHHHPEVLRYFNLASHYRSPVEFSDNNLATVRVALERMYTALRGMIIPDEITESISGNLSENLPSEIKKISQDYELRFTLAMNDDFNTPEALAVLFDLVRELNRSRIKNSDLSVYLGALLKKLGNILGILYEDPQQFLQTVKDGDIDKAKIETLIQERDAARKSKNWAQSDKIRAELTNLGIVLEDTSEGTIWRKEIKSEIEQ